MSGGGSTQPWLVLWLSHCLACHACCLLLPACPCNTSTAALRLLEVRSAYASDDFEWAQLQRLSVAAIKESNLRLMRAAAVASPNATAVAEPAAVAAAAAAAPQQEQQQRQAADKQSTLDSSSSSSRSEGDVSSMTDEQQEQQQ